MITNQFVVCVLFIRCCYRICVWLKACRPQLIIRTCTFPWNTSLISALCSKWIVLFKDSQWRSFCFTLVTMTLVRYWRGKKMHWARIMYTVCFSVIALTDALLVDDGLWPPYASMIIFELYKVPSSASGFAIRVIFNGNVLNLRYCSNQALCDYDEFSNYIATVVPTDVAKQCASRRRWTLV